MFLQILFWLLMVLWLIGILGGWTSPGSGWQPRANSVVTWVLLAILGVAALGIPSQ